MIDHFKCTTSVSLLCILFDAALNCALNDWHCSCCHGEFIDTKQFSSVSSERVQWHLKGHGNHQCWHFVNIHKNTFCHLMSHCGQLCKQSHRKECLVLTTITASHLQCELNIVSIYITDKKQTLVYFFILITSYC